MSSAKQALQERYKKLGHTVQKPNLRAACRLNTLKTKKLPVFDAIVQLEKIRFTNHGYWYKAPFSLSTTPAYLLGHIYIQEAAAQLPVEVLSPAKGETVIDLCAAPGGKTTQIAMYMENTGTLIAIDNKKKRIEVLHNNIERLGVSNTVLYLGDATQIEQRTLPAKADKILVDAPCMGNYADDKNWFEKRSVNQIATRVQLQRKLLHAALSLLKKGGILVYSTCSLEPEENEENIDWLLNTQKISVVPTGLTLGQEGITKPLGKQLHKDVRNTRRIWPGKTQGFFVAKIRKH